MAFIPAPLIPGDAEAETVSEAVVCSCDGARASGVDEAIWAVIQAYGTPAVDRDAAGAFILFIPSRTLSYVPIHYEKAPQGFVWQSI